ncbi:unnamed protein product [Peronospora belbahrii]|uniref:CDAN1-interacting nuclease 1 n=1 Tax=Peronospora belbahrii TaxID=622444 RepID=A0AAU9LER4_9STRA|nr:unnamed protein product [Peronospora belbahrii]
MEQDNSFNCFKEAMMDNKILVDPRPNRRGLSKEEYTRVMQELVFESEDMLREKGLFKTPDVRLLLSIGVKDSNTGQLHVITWTDSKAICVAAARIVNRYGPGMVIYWFGYVAQLSFNGGIFITDSFPSHILLPGDFDPVASVTKFREGVEVKLQPAKIQTDFDNDWILITTCEL